MSVAFEKRLSDICGSIADIESRCALSEARAEVAELRAAEAEDNARRLAQRLEDAEAALDVTVPTLAGAHARNNELNDKVEELQVQLEDYHAKCLETEHLNELLDHERLECSRLEALVAAANLDREHALLDLSDAYADIQAMQAALLDSALHVRFLRARLLELQLAKQESMAAAGQEACKPGESGGSKHMAFSFERTKLAIQAAVKEAAKLERPERSRRLKQLRLRWHPDKNPELQEFASEVTKIINKAVEELDL